MGRVALRAATGVLALIGLLTILAIATPLADVIARPLVVRGAPRPADVIVVLGGGMYEDGNLRDGSMRRLVSAIKLYREGYAPLLLLSTGNPTPSGVTEAGAMARDARVLGVPEAALIVEERSTRTADNALAIATIARQRGFTRILVVTSPTHTRRAGLVFRKVGLDVTLVPTGGVQTEEWGTGRLVLCLASLREYLGLLYYKLRGWA